ncbi:homocysteine S-methyltransferase family protein [Striga asiatica]|uniref:Homocysteine S-methyltransferase family protein n=1 Tax=Striga asiatica TaxID=4170 RepID=A0A5A7RIS0_STRAF|nr:homocysteine S-methyltransferase family protein [Striga asiatica]
MVSFDSEFYRGEECEMGSVGFNGEVESQPSASNYTKYNLPKTLLVGCDGDSHALVPRKLRSAIKKRARKTATSPLSISKKRRVSNKDDCLKKYGRKKSKPKRAHITKDEEEVAETLYALATMFSHPNKANKPASSKLLNNSQEETGVSANAVEDTRIWPQREESEKTSSKVTREVTCCSPNISRSEGKLVKLQSCNGVKKSDRPRVSSEQLIDQEQVTASGDRYGKKYNPMCYKYNSSKNLGSSQSPTEMQSCDTPGSSLRSPVWVENTNATSQPLLIENSITNEKCTQIAVQSENSWKRSSTHVYISRLIKVWQIPKNKEESSKKSPAKIEQDIFLNKRIIQDEQLAPEASALCSAKVGFYDFLSLGTEYCSSHTSADINREGHSHEGREQFHSGLLPFSLSPNSSSFHGHNSALTPQEVQLPEYPSSSTVNGNFAAKMEMQPQKQWLAQHKSGVGPTQLNDWKNGTAGPPPSTVNCAERALLPHLLGPKDQQVMSSAAISSSLPLQNMKIDSRYHQQLLHNRQIPLGFFERNRAAFCLDNVQQLQLPYE